MFDDLKLITKNRFNSFKRTVKFFIQRKTRGWDDSETWSLDYSLSKLILPRIKRFKELHQGYPSELTSEKWDEILDKMIFAFEFLGSEDRWDKFGEEHLEEWSKAKEGTKLFGEYFTHLWW